MDTSEKEQLIREYTEGLRYYVHYPMKLVGINRFDLTPDRIVKRTLSSLIYSTIIMLIMNVCAFYLLYSLTYKKKYLEIPEVVAVVLFDVFHLGVLLNLTFINPGRVADVMNSVIEIDVFLGVKNTKFLRDISVNTYVFLVVIDGFFNVAVLVVMHLSYIVDIDVAFVTAIYVIVLFFIYYDLSFFVSLYTFLTLRVRYLNVSLMRITNVGPQHMPKQIPFNNIFWYKKHNDLVDFHTRSEPYKTVQAFRMLFSVLRGIENYYRFTIFMCLLYLIIGTFAIVQNFIIYAKSMDMDTIRLIALTGWGVLSWSFQIGIAVQVDMFYRQIQQTRLLCTYIQLKPTYSDSIYKLTSNIIDTLEIRDARMSIYGLFYYDTGLLLTTFASLFVYITMQLQFAFAKIDDLSILNNATNIST